MLNQWIIRMYSNVQCGKVGKKQAGVTSIEYGLIAAGMAAVAIAAFDSNFGTITHELTGQFIKIANDIKFAG